MTSDVQNNSLRTKIDFNKFKCMLLRQDWSYITSIQDPEVAASSFMSKYAELLKKATIEYRGTSKKYKKIKQWITRGIVESIKHRDRMKKNFLKIIILNCKLDIRIIEIALIS